MNKKRREREENESRKRRESRERKRIENNFKSLSIHCFRSSTNTITNHTAFNASINSICLETISYQRLNNMAANQKHLACLISTDK
jgi:hypothetical protein